MSNIIQLSERRPQVLEFFAGIGLARLGLEEAGFHVSWANDYEADKQSMYEGHFGAPEGANHSFHLGDIGGVKATDLPTGSSVAWASSPCTDLSLAGARAGLDGDQSGVFWHFVRLLDDLGESRPPIAVLENVNGLATSRGGDDLAAAIRAFNKLDYSVDVLAIDARRFVPQSRPRIFLVAAIDPPDDALTENSDLRPDWLQSVFGDHTLRTHRAALPELPPPLTEGFGKLVEEIPLDDERWWEVPRLAAFIGSLSPLQRDRFNELKTSSGVKYRTAYRRTRNGQPAWEVRADDISGCLRTARGGSSKQAVVRLGNKRVQVRWMTPREYSTAFGPTKHYSGLATRLQSRPSNGWLRTT
jgi:DNA (cytosine-5)-methyltransferase 1